MGPITPEMLGRLYREHAPALLLYARQWCRSAEDLVQDAFVALARQRRIPEHPIPWLYSVVRNAALMASRGDTRRRRREAVVSMPEAWFSTADDRIDAARAAELLAELPLEQREIIVARIWGGLTFEDVAAVTGCSLATAHRRYHAGLSELQARLDASWTPTANTPKTI